jgi:hypothetical protein
MLYQRPDEATKMETKVFLVTVTMELVPHGLMQDLIRNCLPGPEPKIDEVPENLVLDQANPERVRRAIG